MGEIENLRKPATKEITDILGSYAEALRKERVFATCLVATRRALALDPTSDGLWGELGCCLMNMGRYSEAEEPLQKAISLAPKVPHNHGNLALLYHSLRDFGKANVFWESAIELSLDLGASPEATEADKVESRRLYLSSIWDRALLRLESGDWEGGLGDYESRIELRGAPLYPKMPIPLWAGEDLSGKTLYVQAEQGLGDRILFSRYLKVLKDRWPTCTIKGCFNEALADLFWDFRHITDMLPHGIPWPDGLDFGIHQASLPFVLGTRPETIPPDPGLILKRVQTQAALGTWVGPVPLLTSLKIGIAWTGNPEQAKNHTRTIPLEKMLSLGEDPGVTLYSFQVGPGTEDLVRLRTGEIICDLGPELAKNGLVAAGVAMLEMDVIVTACTATAHLAGALGVPTWTLLSWDAYWVWMTDPSSTPWYPSMRLFRQETPGDWDSVLARVKTELKTLQIVDYPLKTFG